MKAKPVWYRVSADESMIHPDNKRRMASRMDPRGTVELPASYASLAAQPAAIADLIDEACSATG